MAYCHECDVELRGDQHICYLCGEPLTRDKKSAWVKIGTVNNHMSAEYARETLKEYDVPIVVISKSGFFGNVGLPLSSFWKSEVGLFEVYTPAVYQTEAGELLEMVLGNSWKPQEH
ncbi:MAG: hypothetical protein ACE5FH_00750 [Candidatus Zixiibacteriota bacterium]